MFKGEDFMVRWLVSLVPGKAPFVGVVSLVGDLLQETSTQHNLAFLGALV